MEYAIQDDINLKSIISPNLLQDIFRYYISHHLKEPISQKHITTYINPIIQVLYNLIPSHWHKFFEISIKRNARTQYIEIRSPNLLLQILKKGIDSLNKNKNPTYIIIDKKNQNRAILRSFKECYGNIEATENFTVDFVKTFMSLASDIKRIQIPKETFTPRFFHRQILPYLIENKKDELAAYQSRIQSKYI